MKLAINAQMLASRHTLAEAADLVRSLGVEAIEIWPQNIPGGSTTAERERYEQKDVIQAGRILQNAGITVACVTLGFNAMKQCLAGGVATGTAALQGAVDAACQLGARIVNCYMIGIPKDLFIAAAKPAAAYAGERGVCIVLENEAHDDSGTAEGMRDILAAVDSPHFSTLYDPCNYYHAYEEPYPYAYDVLQDRIKYVHLKGGCYYPAGASYKGSPIRGYTDRFAGYLPLPESAFNVEAIVRCLTTIGYNGYIALEPHVPADVVPDFLREEAPYLQRLLSAMQITSDRSKRVV